MPIGKRSNRDCAGSAVGEERYAVNRIDCDIKIRGGACTDPLSHVQHGSLIFLPLPNHYRTIDLQRTQGMAHRVNSGLIGAIAVAPTHQTSRRQGGSLGDPAEFEREVSIH
jgi:hypothetical protein